MANGQLFKLPLNKILTTEERSSLTETPSLSQSGSGYFRKEDNIGENCLFLGWLTGDGWLTSDQKY